MLWFLSRVGRLLWLIGRVGRLLLLLWPLGLESRGVANLFKWNSAATTLCLQKFNVDLFIQLDKVVDLVLPELPNKFVL